jgi:hypothetical protein
LLYLDDMALPRRLAWVTALAALLASTATAGPVELTYLYDLADFTGRIPYSDARVVVDAPRSEVYTVYGNEIRAFNNAGMEIYRFGVDPAEGRVADLAIESSGDILLLMYASGAGEGARQWSLLRADFRGRPTGKVDLDRSGGAADLLPNRLLLRAGRIWLLSQGQMRAASYLPGGKLERALDLAELAALPEADRGNAEVTGLDVGGDGTVVFVIPEQFRVHAIDPAGGVRSFGKPGSSAGKFGVLGDVALDGDGNVYISDRQRGVVMVFNREFHFLRETDRISNREGLARPGGLALDPAGRLYISQMRRRGVAVFAIAPAP